MLTFVLPVSLFLPPSGQRAFLLENVPCNTGSCHSVGRMFHIHWDQSDLGAIQNAVMATFFDIYEDVSSLCWVNIVSMRYHPCSHSFRFSTLATSVSSVKCPSAQCLLLFDQGMHWCPQSYWYRIIRHATAVSSPCQKEHEAKWTRKMNKSHGQQKNFFFFSL